MSPEQRKRVEEIAFDTFNMPAQRARVREAIFSALADPILQQKDEYICKCGLRVTPHRCKTGSEF